MTSGTRNAETTCPLWSSQTVPWTATDIQPPNAWQTQCEVVTPIGISATGNFLRLNMTTISALGIIRANRPFSIYLFTWRCMHNPVCCSRIGNRASWFLKSVPRSPSSSRLGAMAPYTTGSHGTPRTTTSFRSTTPISNPFRGAFRTSIELHRQPYQNVICEIKTIVPWSHW